jgi:isoleucyl-tRNA synthetase
MLAPILAFTADEAWEFVPGKTVESAHELTWQPMNFQRPEPERAAWQNLLHLRELALPALEKARQAKQIGKALDAKLIFAGAGAELNRAEDQLEALRELLNVSQLEIQPGAGDGTIVSVTKAAGQKCERCWHWELDVGLNPEHPTLCGRCVQAVQANAPVQKS